MMLDKVRTGELGVAPAADAADSIRAGWLVSFPAAGPEGCSAERGRRLRPARRPDSTAAITMKIIIA